MSSFRIYYPYPQQIPYELTPILTPEEYQQFLTITNTFRSSYRKQLLIGVIIVLLVCLSGIPLIVKGSIPNSDGTFYTFYLVIGMVAMFISVLILAIALAIIVRRYRKRVVEHLNKHYSYKGLSFYHSGYGINNHAHHYFQITTATPIMTTVMPYPMQQQPYPYPYNGQVPIHNNGQVAVQMPPQMHYQQQQQQQPPLYYQPTNQMYINPNTPTQQDTSITVNSTPTIDTDDVKSPLLKH